eukprot:CAMPEP_0113869962 /NCGR_PEP_ID=MMETSP0780_2-20120614/1821_1 /TAXON_ID=652834 /ORGANISM="Palpitomonas bilix" /LENGTH=283 /DNA_ID=CAMNT_0000855185 /DNA_START=64 /DNA_END=915 /DNA_ORIENTATION=- /assembly_acc=CAM_ASM_000599
MASPAAAEAFNRIRNQWNAMSKYFRENVESSTLALTNQLVSMAKCYRADGVLELGAGCGGAAAARALLMKEGARHVVSDLSEKMVDHCKEVSASLPAGRQFEAMVLNAEDTGLEAESFNAIIANLVIQITPSADAMMKECARLLKKDGRLAVSFWGEKAKSPMFTLVPQSVKELGVNLAERGVPPPPKDNFELGQDLEGVKKRFLAAGFSKVFIYHSPMNLDVVSAEEFAKGQLEAPMAQKMLSVLSEEEKVQLEKIIAKNAASYLDNDKLIGLDAVIALAIK